jgi:hypothetical protein
MELKPSQKLAQMSEVFNILLSAHIIELLKCYYENAQVGDNPLELPEEFQVPFGGPTGAKITGIELFFEDKKEIMYYHLDEVGVTVHKHPIVNLPLLMQLRLLAAYENFCGYTHDVEFYFPVTKPKYNVYTNRST